jgi:hypothetical protein
MSLYLTIREMHKVLGQLNVWLDKGVAHATAKKFDPESMLTWRIAPDMFPLTQQIQFTCDQAKFAASRGAGKDTPAHPDTEKTIAELRARIATVTTYLDTFKQADFDGAADRTISLPRWEGKKMSVLDYVTEHAMPNFFFHATTTYLLLRHNGVDVGKRDFLGALNYRS